MTNEIVHLFNTQPRIFHLPPKVELVHYKDGAGNPQTMHRIVAHGKMVPPSAPKVKDGPMQPTAISAEEFDRIKSNAQVRVWLGKGWLRVGDVGEAGTEGPDSLMKFNAKTALTLVDGETSVKILTDWQGTESRAEVKTAIADRLAELQTAPKAAKK